MDKNCFDSDDVGDYFPLTNIFEILLVVCFVFILFIYFLTLVFECLNSPTIIYGFHRINAMN